ncbi:MAG: prepilin peptidase [Lachnospiraceae bacterium]|nr:prepilin peptidase [Clostridiales bacterium]MDY4769401.1 prepilin peptidase [Lachnospiraceae bacterium]
MEHFLIMSFLGINSWIDIQKKQISLVSVGFFMAVGILYECVVQNKNPDVFWGLLPGAVLLGVSKLSREALGMGDALLMLVLGIYLGLEAALDVLLLALFLAAVWAGILIVVGKKGRNYAFPFVPFLLIGYVGRWLLCHF